jgi:hypothetical protein
MTSSTRRLPDPAQLWDHDIDDADSEKSDGSNHEEHNDIEVEDEEDLQDVPADVLSRTFAQEVSITMI